MKTDAKIKHVDFKRQSLLKRLEKLKSQIENPEITEEQLKAIRAEVEECQKQFKELGLDQTGS